MLGVIRVCGDWNDVRFLVSRESRIGDEVDETNKKRSVRSTNLSSAVESVTSKFVHAARLAATKADGPPGLS